VIRSANTAYYSRGTAVQDLRSAFVRLGHETVLGIALTVTLKPLFASESQALSATLKNLWRQTVSVAYLSRELAGMVTDIHPELTYLMALYHNVGEMILARVVGKEANPAQESFADLVAEIAQKTHPAIGASLLRSWRMGADLEAIARYHHEPDKLLAGTSPATAAHVINAAYRTVLTRGLDVLPSTDPRPSLDESTAYLGISPEELELAWERVEGAPGK